ncbi:MAG TPA: transglutaminaseTgpA domain-containing protein, partial [Acidimicrobiales bacterium]|nr:transglutaminaseTgpA domain-containing protein [Acidimicrobiales bacterium]
MTAADLESAPGPLVRWPHPPVPLSLPGRDPQSRRDAVEVVRPVDVEPFSAGEDLALSASTLALVLAASAGFFRVFVGNSWVVPVTATSTTVGAVGFVFRRARLPTPVNVALCLAGLCVASAATELHGSLQWSLPLVRSVKAAAADSGQAIAVLANTPVPAKALPGFVLWASWATGLSALAGCWLASRHGSLGALLPSFGLFLATCMMGTGRGGTWVVVTFVATAVLFALVRQWVAFGRGHELRYEVWAVLVAIGVGVSLALVPALGSDGPGSAGWSNSSRSSVRVTPSPLVSLQRDLLYEPRVPVFMVHSRMASYWRLTSLAFFNGTSWSASGTYQAVRGRLPDVEAPAGARDVIETFRIADLGSPWLPVAFQPESIGGAVKVEYDPLSGSLLTAGQTTSGDTYQVVAAEDLPLFTPGLLSHVPTMTAGDRYALAEFLQLPKGIPTEVARFAHRLMPASWGEYQKAITLQNFFRQAPFVYTLQPSQTAGADALSSFLFETHAGYCQQYATAFAVLARIAGLPARIAVGFSEGIEIAPGTWQVLGSDAHSWPEVWFPRVGWVPFEPTPSFDIPGAGRYAGPQGSVASSAGDKTAAVSVPAPVPTSARTRTSRPSPVRPPGHRLVAKTWAPLAMWVPGACLAAASLVFGLALARRARVANRRRAPKRLSIFDADPEVGTCEDLLPLWDLLSERLALLGLVRRPSETPIEWARRSSAALQGLGPVGLAKACALVEVCEAFTHAAYGSWRP